MKRFLSALVLSTFAIVMQMSFVHAIDMEIGHNTMVMDMAHAPEHDWALCNENTSTNTESCFTEITESKWIEIVRKIEFAPIFFITLFVFSLSSLSEGISRSSQKGFRRRVFYEPTLYLGLYGIIRNVN